MGGGNAQKSATARARKLEKDKASGKGSQKAQNEAAKNIVCQICRSTFLCTSSQKNLEEHSSNKHNKTLKECFPNFSVN